jgi:hypothetical protein
MLTLSGLNLTDNLTLRPNRRQRHLLFPSSAGKTIPFNKDGLANVLSFGGQRCGAMAKRSKKKKSCQRLSKRRGPNLRKLLPTNLRS